MKKLILLLLLISNSAWAQQTPQQNDKDFNTFAKVEEAEKYYNDLVAKFPEDASNEKQYSEYRAQLAVDWLIKGNIKKYKFYKKTNPEFTALQLFDLSNLLEDWVYNNKNIPEAKYISNEILEEMENNKEMYNDRFDRRPVLYLINAVANAKIGNIDIAMKNIEKSGALQSQFMQFPYFRNTAADFLNHYATVLSAAGQHQRALDTLSKAIRTAASTPYTSEILKTVYKKVTGSKKGVNQYIAALQDEAYQKIYKEVEKEWYKEPESTPDIVLSDINGKAVKLLDYKGKIVVIDFWSTVCKPCVAAFPAFERVVELYKNEPFQLFVINCGEDRESVKLFMDKKGYKLDVLFDNNEALFKALDALGTPQKFIIDSKGNINLMGIGYAGSDDKEFYKLKAMVELTKVRSSGN
ncbi:MAG: TlpA disulfide reductase family protein [Bacteroidales bacterium]|nr:TlpA family protein disulfide reductase [Bacteroidales bacterium]MDD2425748.1 TlpA disulfide reductase family protein [Bacteroidales bacterium]MDD3989528.1 TlpA disulfide reductase family protein [Bacteroidales bacterium]MDD4639072.1 TlpA disulfide reductase family protein [Bacteroidales bacterium]